jgi:hypothetical protein
VVRNYSYHLKVEDICVFVYLLVEIYGNLKFICRLECNSYTSEINPENNKELTGPVVV